MLLVAAMKALGVQVKDLAAATGYDPVTISRYRQPDYDKGPPVEKRRRRLEQVLGVPEGYLDDAAQVDLERLAQLRRGAVRESRVAPYSEADGEPEGPGWQFGDPMTWDEEQLRTVIDHLDRTFRASLTSLDEAGRRQLKVVALREMIRAARERGRPLPDFAYRFLHELETGER